MTKVVDCLVPHLREVVAVLEVRPLISFTCTVAFPILGFLRHLSVRVARPGHYVLYFLLSSQSGEKDEFYSSL